MFFAIGLFNLAQCAEASSVWQHGAAFLFQASLEMTTFPLPHPGTILSAISQNS